MQPLSSTRGGRDGNKGNQETKRSGDRKFTVWVTVCTAVTLSQIPNVGICAAIWADVGLWTSGYLELSDGVTDRTRDTCRSIRSSIAKRIVVRLVRIALECHFGVILVSPNESVALHRLMCSVYS